MEGKEAIFFTLYYGPTTYVTGLGAALCLASSRSIRHRPLTESLTESQAGQTTAMSGQDSPGLTASVWSLANARYPSRVSGGGSGDDSSHAKIGVPGSWDKSPCGGPSSLRWPSVEPLWFVFVRYLTFRWPKWIGVPLSSLGHASCTPAPLQDPFLRWMN